MSGLPPLRTPEDDPHGVYLRLAAQGALLGAIGPSVRTVGVEYRGQAVLFEAHVDADATTYEREALEVAATEVIADYPDGWLQEVGIRDDANGVANLRWCVYQRRSN